MSMFLPMSSETAKKATTATFCCPTQRIIAV
jgi:hypothetical protein